MNIKQISRMAVAVVAVLLLAHTARADVNYNISLDTTSMLSASNAPYYLYFNFTSGTGSSDGNNTATLGGFSFLGSSAGLNGSVSINGFGGGDTTTSILLTNTSTPTEWYQAINVGTTNISFNLDLTSLVNLTIPDRFSIGVLDSSLGQIFTTAPDTVSLITIDLDGTATNTVATYMGDTNAGAPAVIANVSAVPEPSTYLLFGIGALVLVVAFRRRPA
jgi:hypothetical protein